jgi:hypothetical protein
VAAAETAALRSELERFSDGVPRGEEPAALAAFRALKVELNAGRVRAAEREPDGRWRAKGWVKSGILLGFRLGRMEPAATGGPFPFFDKDTYPPGHRARRRHYRGGRSVLPRSSALHGNDR